MKRFFLLYGVSMVTFLLVDVVWISQVIGPLFRAEVGEHLAESFRPGPALVFYALFVLGILLLVVYPSSQGGWGILLGRATLFGACCYGTYELTNYATLSGWSLKIVLLDLAWGMAISCLVASVAFGLNRSWLTG